MFFLRVYSFKLQLMICYTADGYKPEISRQEYV